MTLTLRRSTPSSPTPSLPVPMTRGALRALEAELADLRSAAGQGPSELEPGVIRLPVRGAAERIDHLLSLLERASLEADPGVAVVGRRVQVREEDGTEDTHALVAPGDGDPFHGWLGVDSPMGSAILGTRAGDRVMVQAPAGSRWLTVVSVR